MQGIKAFLKWFFIVLFVANTAIFFSGNTHLYKGLMDTYFRGRTKPTINDPNIFFTRTLKAKNTKSWNISSKLNSKSLAKSTKITNDTLRTKAFLVIKGDEIIHESYYGGYTKDQLSNSFSMAKSVLSILSGIALKANKIVIEAPVYDYIPEFIRKEDTSLTVKHLLTMTSGLNFRESYGNPFGFMAKAYYGTELKELTKGFKLEKDPGSKFTYLGGNNLLLGFTLESALKEKVGNYGSKELWEKLGMENDAKWILDHEDGDEKTFSGIYATARDFAKIGKLYMNKGNMYGAQIVDTSYVEVSVAPINVPDENNRNTDYYGYSWWLAKYKGHEVFYMRGILGQYVICVPDKDLIITRLGELRSKNRTRDGVTPEDVWIYLDEGFRLIE
jgi:CubicO group peptidase (beta-lactamase class C family)